MNLSTEIYIKTLIEKHNKVKEQFQKTINTLVANNDANKIDQAKVFRKFCLDLKTILADAETPNWLRVMDSELFTYIENHKNAATLIHQLINNKKDLVNHSWKLKSNNSIDFDLDQIYEDIIASLNVKELFETLIDYLSQILESGEIDSVAAREALKQLLSIVKQNKGSSYLQLRFIARFAGNFLKNATWLSLKKVSELKIIVDATEKTIKDLNDKDKEAYNEIKKKVAEKFNSGVGRISNNTSHLLADKSNDIDN